MTAAARIHDRGYSRYTDERTGTGGAVRSLYRQTLQQALGFRRSVWQKILPFLSIVLAYLPAIAFVGMAAFANTQPRAAAQVQELLPTYAEYYGFVYAAILVFVAFVAPELLCADRRTGMLGLYLASPLMRHLPAGARRRHAHAAVAGDARAAAVDARRQHPQRHRPDQHRRILTTLGQVLVSGVVIGAFYGALSLAVASLTTRRAFATVGIVFILFGSSVLTQLLIRAPASARTCSSPTCCSCRWSSCSASSGSRGTSTAPPARRRRCRWPSPGRDGRAGAPCSCGCATAASR
ncbi:MAG: hypothetical protein R2690_05505 [Acidimicrobiales bacterium]